MSLTIHDQRLALSIQDDGCGFDTSQTFSTHRLSGWGLLGMKERAELAGGKLSVQSQPGEGTTIVAQFDAISEEQGTTS
jgi:two-component system sensor histidine kinase NreB